MSVRMKSATNAATVIGLSLLCGSCSKGSAIDLSGTGADIRISFVDRGFLWNIRKEVCVSELTVWEEAWPTRRELQIVWQIKSANGCMKMTEVRLGKVPRSFVQEINLLPLKLNSIYSVTAGAGQIEEFSGPWVICRGDPAKMSWKNEYRLNEPPARCRP